MVPGGVAGAFPVGRAGWSMRECRMPAVAASKAEELGERAREVELEELDMLPGMINLQL